MAKYKTSEIKCDNLPTLMSSAQITDLLEELNSLKNGEKLDKVLETIIKILAELILKVA